MPTLREFIAVRQREIQEQMVALRAEASELKTALAALDGVPAQTVQRHESSKPTIKDMVVDVLEGKPQGGLADEIIEWVKAAHQVDVPRSSMSPQLSRLKVDGAVTLDNSTKIWRLARYVESAPAENSETAASEEAKAEHAGGMFGLHDPNHTPTRQ